MVASGPGFFIVFVSSYFRVFVIVI